MSSNDKKFAKKNRPVQTIKSKVIKKSQKKPEEPLYSIEKILSIKTQKGKKLCRIKWLGWDQQKDITWEPFQNIPKDAIDQYYQQKKNQNSSVKSDQKPESRSQQGKKGLKTSMMGSLPRRPKIVIPSEDSSLSHIGQSSSQNDQSSDQQDQQSQFNEERQSVGNAQDLLSQSNKNQQAKSLRKLRHLRGNQHVTLQKRLRNRTNQKPNPKRGRKKRKCNEFSDDQDEDQNSGRKPVVIGQTKIKYPTHLQTAEQYPDHQLYSTQKLDPDYEKYVRGCPEHINSSGQFSEGEVSVGDISDSSHEQGDSYHTERSQRGIPQNTLKRIITKLHDQHKNQTYYKVETFDRSILMIKQHHIKTYFPRLLVEFQEKIIKDLQQILKQKNQKEQDKQQINRKNQKLNVANTTKI